MAMPGGPQPADRILILKQPWLDLILQGAKTLEIRSRPLSSGRYWLGHKKMIFGVAVLGEAIPVLSAVQWASLRSRHRCGDAAPPYKKTYATPVLSAQATLPRVRFHYPRGAIGIVRFRHD